MSQTFLHRVVSSNVSLESFVIVADSGISWVVKPQVNITALPKGQA